MTARKRSSKGQFVKNLRPTPPGSREWLIWSRYHGAWHRRSEKGGANGYTTEIAAAGIFDRTVANAYNDGDRDEAFHVSEKLIQLRAAQEIHTLALANLSLAIEQATK